MKLSPLILNFWHDIDGIIRDILFFDAFLYLSSTIIAINYKLSAMNQKFGLIDQIGHCAKLSKVWAKTNLFQFSQNTTHIEFRGSCKLVRQSDKKIYYVHV